MAMQWLRRGAVRLAVAGASFGLGLSVPDTRAAIAAAIEALGPMGAQIQPVFVTLDRSRDRPELTYVLDADGSFAGYFPPGTSGARIVERVREMASNR